MKGKKKYLFGFLIITGVLVYLLFTTFSSSLQYYVTASELKKSENSYRGKVLKVAGLAQGVVRGEEGGASVYRFTVVEEGASFPVIFKGIAPDTFKDKAQVVVTGTLNRDGTFVATEILAKCASKYEAKVKQ